MKRFWSILVLLVLVAACGEQAAAPKLGVQLSEHSVRSKGEVHTGGTLHIRAPAKTSLTLETPKGETVTDGSLGSLVETGKTAYAYHAPLKVPEAATVIVRATKDTPSGKSVTHPVMITEGRATYLRPFDALAKEPGGPGLPALSRADREDEASGRARIITELERAEAAGFNTVFVEAYYHGYTLWPTEVGKQRPSTLSGGVTVYEGDNPVTGEVVRTWDPMQVYLEEGHKRGLEIHLWFEAFYVWTRYFQGGTGRVPSTSSWLWNDHPEWFDMKRVVEGVNEAGEVVSVSEDGKYFLDPANLEVQAFNLELMDEALTRYPSLDGVQLDYIRHPRHTSGTAPSWYGSESYYDYFGFNPVTFARFSAESGISADQLDPTEPTGTAWETFSAWKTANVTDFVRKTQALVRGANPEVKLSVSIFPNFSDGLAKMQDTRTWVEEKLIDIVMPQLYYTSLASVAAVGDPFLEQVRGEVVVYPTFYIPHFYDLSAGDFEPEGEGYLTYAARRGVEGTALFILTGASTGVSNEMAEDLGGEGGLYEHDAPPSHR